MRPVTRLPLLILSALLTVTTAVAAGPRSGGRPLIGQASDSPTARRVAILCYHDLSDAPGGRMESVSPESLRAQIRRSRAAGWTFLSLSELLQHREHPGDLPQRVMVLTFDDGYRSFYERALPILREEKVKATIAIISSFIDHPPADLPPLMSWSQIREAERSGWAEVASHTHRLHHWDASNPAGCSNQAATTRLYHSAERRYETRDEYRARVRADVRESQRVLSKALGHDVKVLVWPYGEHNAMIRTLAAEEGFPVTLALGDAEVRAEDLRAGCLPRVMILKGIPIGADDLRWLYPRRAPMRAARVDLDDLWDADARNLEARVARMVERVRALGANTVFLEGCPDPAGDGFVRETWFMNHQIPIRADLWSAVACRFQHARIRVWIRAPSLNLSWAWERHPEWRIPSRAPEVVTGSWYYRISPDLIEARRAAVDFYTDLAVYLPIDGVLFDDDAAMLPGERLAGSGDESAAAKADAIRRYLDEIRSAVRTWRPACRFGRVLRAPVVERAGVNPEFAQDFDQSLADEDLTVIAADLQQLDSGDAGRGLTRIARRAASRWKPTFGHEGEAPPVMIMLPTLDRDSRRPLPAARLETLVGAIRRGGLRDVGIGPLQPDSGDLPAELLLERVGRRRADPMTAAER